MKQIYLHVKITPAMKRKLDKMVKEQRRSISEVVRILVEAA